MEASPTSNIPYLPFEIWVEIIKLVSRGSCTRLTVTYLIQASLGQPLVRESGSFGWPPVPRDFRSHFIQILSTDHQVNAAWKVGILQQFPVALCESDRRDRRIWRRHSWRLGKGWFIKDDRVGKMSPGILVRYISGIFPVCVLLTPVYLDISIAGKTKHICQVGSCTISIGFTLMFQCTSLPARCAYRSEGDLINPLRRQSLTFSAFATYLRIGMTTGMSYLKLSRLQVTRLAWKTSYALAQIWKLWSSSIPQSHIIPTEQSFRYRMVIKCRSWNICTSQICTLTGLKAFYGQQVSSGNDCIHCRYSTAIGVVWLPSSLGVWETSSR